MPSDGGALSAGGGRQGPAAAAAAGHVALYSAGPEAWLEDSAGSLAAEAEMQALLHDVEVTNSGSARGSKPPVSVPAAPSPSPCHRAPLRRLVSKFTLRSELGDESWEVYQHEAKRWVAAAYGQAAAVRASALPSATCVVRPELQLCHVTCMPRSNAGLHN